MDAGLKSREWMNGLQLSLSLAGAVPISGLVLRWKYIRRSNFIGEVHSEVQGLI
jgi:hypothetical protein